MTSTIIPALLTFAITGKLTRETHFGKLLSAKS